jgi:hypothetical protein
MASVNAKFSRIWPFSVETGDEADIVHPGHLPFDPPGKAERPRNPHPPFDAARGGQLDAAEKAHQRRFPGPVAAEHGQTLALAQVEAEIVDHGLAADRRVERLAHPHKPQNAGFGRRLRGGDAGRAGRQPRQRAVHQAAKRRPEGRGG